MVLLLPVLLLLLLLLLLVVVVLLLLLLMLVLGGNVEDGHGGVVRVWHGRVRQRGLCMRLVRFWKGSASDGDGMPQGPGSGPFLLLVDAAV